MRIGILGGTFNPIHLGHLYIAETTRVQLSLDRIMFIPTGEPPHKSLDSLAHAPHRMEMVRLAIAGHPHFAVSDIESRSHEKSFTIDTLHALQASHSTGTEFFFIIGLDAFLDLPSWKHSEQLLGTANFVVISRPHTQFRDLVNLALLPAVDPSTLESLDSGLTRRFDLPTSPSTRLILLALPFCEISASAIRQHLKEGTEVSAWLPPSVESYIIHHGLYHS